MDIPNTFNPNTTAESAKVNQNFTNVKTAVDTIEAFTFRQYIALPGVEGILSSTYVNLKIDSGRDVDAYFTFDKSKLGDVQAIYFQCLLRTNNASTTAYAQLYNITDAAIETTLTSADTTSGNLETSSDIKATIPNANKTYVCKLKGSNTSNAVYAGGAYLIVDYKIS